MTNKAKKVSLSETLPYWIEPKPDPSLLNYYAIVDDSTYFSILIRKKNGFMSLFQSRKRYRLALKCSEGDNDWVVATSDEYNQVKLCYQYLLYHYVKRLEESDNLIGVNPIRYLQDRVLNQWSMKDQYQEMSVYEEIENSFRDRFPDLTLEILVYSYAFSFINKLGAGWIYFTNSYVCLYNKLDDNSKSIKFLDIRDIKKKTYGFEIITDDSELSITVVNSEALVMLFFLWNRALDRELSHTEAILRTNEEDVYEIPLEMRRNTEFGKHSLIRSVKEMRDIKERNRYHSIFRVPDTDDLKRKMKTGSLMRDNETITGDFYVSDFYFGFCSKNAKNIYFFLPIIFITDIIENLNEETGFVCIVTIFENLFFRFSSQEEMMYITNFWTNIMKSDHPPIPIVSETERDVSNVLKLRQLENLDTQKYQSEQQASLELWNNTIDSGFSDYIIRHSKLKELVYQGIPDSKRGFIWQYISGSVHFSWLTEKNYYKSLVKEHSTFLSVSKEQIENDITRSLPNHGYYQTEEGLGKLRNVLLAYAWRNSSVGYCQSMNVLAAVLLLFMDEEDAFFMLCTICERLLPRYFNRAMLGSHADVKILESYINIYAPEISIHLEDYNVPGSALYIPWFLCLFVGYIPIDTAFRIIDIFYLEGVEILIKSALALLIYKKNKILSCQDTFSIITVIKEMSDITFYDIQTIWEEQKIYVEVSNYNRMRKTASLIHSWIDSTKKHTVNNLSFRNKLSSADVDRLYLLTKGYSENNDLTVNKRCFGFILFDMVPEWSNLTDGNVADRCYDLYAKESKTINLEEMVKLLSVLLVSRSKAKYDLCFDIIDTDNKDCLNLLQVSQVFYLFLSLYQTSDFDEVLYFIQMMFEKLQKNLVESTISRQEAYEELVEKPLFSGYFNIKLQ
eukprot:TRINITY_DN6740_c0_g1_i1.p1 TRINITY_DN6740_c0_g1~~TRINITY_DN6740_c0_g1_i1.p1  ORF type:complete len:904 (+),score=171.79 TRINITY_DN6740_c0_g1_i1:25-2736(+)